MRKRTKRRMSLKEYLKMSDLYPKCKKCGSLRIARYEEELPNPPPKWPTKSKDGKPLSYGFGNSLLVMTFVCLNCGKRNVDWSDIQETDERVLP